VGDVEVMHPPFGLRSHLWPVTRETVRVVDLDEPPIRGLNLVVGGVFADAQHVVRVGHR
jgi:hypothetical protein